MQTPVSGHAVLVNDEGKVLLLQNIQHHANSTRTEVQDLYIFPGGRLEEGESDPEAALLREIQEETALTRVKILLPLHTSFWGRTFPRFSVIYLARVWGNDPVRIQADEAASFRWESFDDAAKVPFVNVHMLRALEKARVLLPKLADISA